MMFTSFPFVVRAVQPVLADLQGEIEEAASTLGASPWQIFRRVIFPEIPAIPAWRRFPRIRAERLGEFGAVVFIAGNLPFRTEITSLLIFCPHRRVRLSGRSSTCDLHPRQRLRESFSP